MNYRITILLVIALLSVSTSPIVAKSLIGVPAVAISFWRMIIGSFLLWLYSIFYKQGNVKKRKNYSKTILAGILLGLHFSLFFGAIKFDPRSDKWLRISMFQGAPLPNELKNHSDYWVYNSLN